MAYSDPAQGRAYIRQWNRDNPGKVAEYRKKANARLLEKDPEYFLRQSRAYRAADPRRYRQYGLQSRYGMTIDQWDALFESQGRKCGCCGGQNPMHKTGWKTDHDHVTGKVRGIVCHPCNQILTKHATPERLQKAIEFLTREGH